jgi:RNA binding exosome subunit
VIQIKTNNNNVKLTNNCSIDSTISTAVNSNSADVNYAADNSANKPSKIIHNIKLTVFSKDGESHAEIAQSLIELVPLDLGKEKIVLNKQLATGCDDSEIRIFSILLKRQRNVKSFIVFLQNALTSLQKKILVNQAESRLDENLFFYIRFDKSSWLEKRKFNITDSGDCFHLKISIASFPASREKALLTIKEIFSFQE